MRTKDYGPVLTLCALLLLTGGGVMKNVAATKGGGTFGRFPTDGPQAPPELADEQCGTHLMCLAQRHRTLAENSCELHVTENVEKDIRQQLVDAGRDAEDGEVGIRFPYEGESVIGSFSVSSTKNRVITYKGKALIVKDLTTKGKWQRKKYKCVYDLETKKVVEVSIENKGKARANP